MQRTSGLSASALRVLVYSMLAIALSSPALAVDVVGQRTATLSWGPADGPVQGYFVYAARNGETLPGSVIAAASSGSRSIQVSGLVGDSVVISVAAYDTSGSVGPRSAPSEAINFVADNSSPSGGSNNEAEELPLLSDAGLVFVATAATGFVEVQAFRIDGSLAGSFNIVIDEGVAPESLEDIRPAICDLDGDGETEVVLGFGTGSLGRIEIRRGAAEGYAHLDTIYHRNTRYAAENGETFPACGDVDGDGADEIVVGRGPGGSGTIDIYEDAFEDYKWLGFNTILWPEYRVMNGETHPAVGDFDGDGLDEIVLGLGAGGEGRVAVFDDYNAGFRHVEGTAGTGFFSTPLPFAADGATWPAIGDADGDGVDEIVVGMGRGGRGQLYAFEGISFADGRLTVGSPMSTPAGGGLIQAGFQPYNSAYGSVVPNLSDLDGDGASELILSFRGEDLLEVRDDAGTGFAPGSGLVGGDGFVQQAVWGLPDGGPALAR